MITFQNFHGHPHSWSICGICAADLPVLERAQERNIYDGRWVMIGPTIVSIVCTACAEQCKPGRNVPK